MTNRPSAQDSSDALSLSGAHLRNGIWPQSFALWLAAFYIALFVIRPWEKLIPELGTIHFERKFALLMIAGVVLAGRLKFRLDFQTLAVLSVSGAFWLSGLSVAGPSLPYVFLTLVVFYFVLVAVIRTPYELLFMIACYLVAMGLYLGKSQWEF
ncbi:MAG: hypothetical protein GY953_31385, partial [bacterium]|nr:hypothetical protein [bacterium]